MVFNLVNADLLMKNEADSMSDFRNGFDFEEAFDEGFRRDVASVTLDGE